MPGAYDFYFDEMSQVRLPRWSTGRVALLGDAAFGPSPMSGQGTSLALIGAFLLAHHLAGERQQQRQRFHGIAVVVNDQHSMNRDGFRIRHR